MENQFQIVTEIINELAASNPYITKTQIAKAKSMYNGDMRPIDEIRRKLEAYSEQIMAQGKKAEEDKKRFADKVQEEQQKQNIDSLQTNKTDIGPEQPEPQQETEPQMLPNEMENRQLQSMIDEAFSASSNQASQANEYTGAAHKETGKVYVKENNPPSSNTSSTTSEAGVGNVSALLTLTIIFSLVTIIMAFFTIISK